MDQRKVNMLAREYAADKKMRFKPIIISHHMLMGLKEGQEKMSKSDPNSAIFMEDRYVWSNILMYLLVVLMFFSILSKHSVAEVNTKIKKAYCPPEIVEKNPIIDYVRYIILPYYNKITINLKVFSGIFIN